MDRQETRPGRRLEPTCPSACISQLPTSPRGARLAADGSPGSAGAIEPVSECGAPFATVSREPGQSLGPRGEPGSTSAGGGRGRVGRAHVRRHRRLQGSARRASAPVRRGLRGRPRRPGLEQLVARLVAACPELVVLEATGGFEITVAAAVAAAGLPLAVVNPAQIRAFARAIGRLAKTDRLDAELIARFAEQVRPEPRPVLDEQARILAELVARRRQIVEMIGMESNRRRQARSAKVAARHRAHARGPPGGARRARPGDRRPGPRLPGLARGRGPADLGARHRQDHRPHPDRRAARARPPRPPADRRPGRRRPGQPRQRRLARPPGDRRRPRRGAHTSCTWPPSAPPPGTPPSAPSTCACAQRGRPAKAALVAAMRKLLTILNAIMRDQSPVANHLTPNTVTQARRLPRSSTSGG